MSVKSYFQNLFFRLCSWLILSMTMNISVDQPQCGEGILKASLVDLGYLKTGYTVGTARVVKVY